MLFNVLTLLLIVLISVVSLYLIRQYLIYLNFYTVKPPSDKEKLREINKERQIQKHKVSNTSIGVLIVLVLVLSFILVRLLMITNDVNHIQKTVGIEKKKNNGRSNSKLDLTKEETILEYGEEKWQINDFGWDDLLKDERTNQISYELDLSKKLKPFIGENNVSINKGSAITMSVFSVGLTNNQFVKAKQNIAPLVADLNKVAQVSIVDFTFTYYNEKADYQKSSQLFYEENGILKQIEKK